MVDWFVTFNPQAKVVLSVGSSGEKFARAIQSYAAEKGYPVVDFREFLDRPGMRAKGLFRHPGVAWHPSVGMRELGRRYARALGIPMADQ